MKGCIIAEQRFLFPDTVLEEMPEELYLAGGRNESLGVQILAECGDGECRIEVESGEVETEYYEMLDIPVEYNTGDGIDQGGSMIILCEEKPPYAIAKAPFCVYDCLKPVTDGRYVAKNGRVAAYLCLKPKKGTAPGKHQVVLRVHNGRESHTCQITLQVYDVAFEEKLFHKTNWFSLAQVERWHHVHPGTPEFEDMVRAYARTMRRVHQDTVNIDMHGFCGNVNMTKPYRFDFGKIKPLIKLFFEEGFSYIETGDILNRGRREDGGPDMYTADFKCTANLDIKADSNEGYELLCTEMKAFAEFLRENGWENRVLFHIMDEPDVHYKTDADLQARRVQYMMAANIVRRFLPEAKILEAVKTTKFRGAIDIMCPITDGYEAYKAAFDSAIANGDEVWTYVCCAPTGFWLNRFLDSPLVNNRLLAWGCVKNRISGYLHWGYNQFAALENPFQATCAYNDSGIGSDFPCGDAFIVYPGEDGPWLSMRLEAERRGAEEAAMLMVLREKDEAAFDRLVGRLFTSFSEYNNDPKTVEEVHEELLQLLSE